MTALLLVRADRDAGLVALADQGGGDAGDGGSG
jgi:hypothetical protein